jgi:small subunit ribosomal protein S21|tara:strand:- start:109 stop:318 length:210 start_codon:yes stop_codon:yes gene_type:complete
MTIEVTVRNGNVEKAMRVLKKKLLKDGMMRELKERQYYQKPSHVKREAKKQSIRRHKKEQKLRALKEGF